MPRFLIKGSYSPDGVKGLRKDKASGREKSVAAACAALGGKLDAIYYALGDDDIFVVVDLPGHVQAASLCVAVGASGMVSTRTVPLLTVAEMDEALEIDFEVPAARRLNIRTAGRRANWLLYLNKSKEVEMTISAVTRWKCDNASAMVEAARKARTIFAKYSVESLLGRLDTGLAAGDWLFVTRYSDWTAYAKCQDGLTTDAEWQTLLAHVLGMAQRMERNTIVGVDL